MNNKQVKILLAEDEDTIASALILNLNLAGYEVIHASDGSKAIELFKQHNSSIALLLLDVMMPGKSGFDVFSEIKKLSPSIPVIFLTARDQSSDKIQGLKLGADDYITKPFDLEELLLRVKNAVRRSSLNEVKNIFSFSNCSINFDNYEVKDVAGHTLPLSKREIGLLKLLTSQPNKVVSRDKIIEDLWEESENASSRTIDNYILGFRKLFEKDPKNPVHFISIRGVGYKFIE
ncbi:MAG TPA: response regulator transcription factor [Bacteroidia bacterium]|nr:response regulator transcription factor [Bacteroidia bacterium]